jgi:hypothetical protein
MRKKEYRKNIYGVWMNDRSFDFDYNGTVKIIIFDYFLNILQDLYIFMTWDEDKMSIEEINKKEIINNIIGIIYDEE